MRGPGIITALLLLFVVQQSCLADVLVDSDLDSLRSQISSLGKQIKDAETGENAAKKLLEDSRATALSFESEIGQLKASLADKETKGGALEKQLTLLQSEAEKLREGQKLHRDLVTKFEGVTKELEATKETLANTLAQLAEKTSSANSAQLSVTDARQSLKAAEAERDAALERLKNTDSSAEENLKESRRLHAELAKKDEKYANLEEKVKSDAEARAKLEGVITDLRGKLTLTEMDAKEWKRETEDARKQADSAKKAVASAELKLEKALKDHTATQTALIQAESKAEEALKKMETLLTSWLPHWLDDRYQQLLQSVDPARRKVEPLLQKTWAQGKAFTLQGQKNAKSLYRATQKRSLKAYKQLKPTLDKLWLEIQKLLRNISVNAQKLAGPQWQKLRRTVIKRYNSTYRNVSAWLSKNPQVRRIRRSLDKTIKDLEKLAISYLGRIPFLKPYAKKPEVTYLVWAILAAPIVTILAPLFVFKSEKKQKRVNLDTRNVAIGRGGVTPEPRSKTQVPPKTKKSRRISVGEEHVRVP